MGAHRQSPSEHPLGGRPHLVRAGGSYSVKQRNLASCRRKFRGCMWGSAPTGAPRNVRRAGAVGASLSNTEHGQGQQLPARMSAGCVGAVRTAMQPHFGRAIPTRRQGVQRAAPAVGGMRKHPQSWVGGAGAGAGAAWLRIAAWKALRVVGAFQQRGFGGVRLGKLC